MKPSHKTVHTQITALLCAVALACFDPSPGQAQPQPIGTNDFRISTIGEDGNTTLFASTPASAYNLVNNEYLVVWKATLPGGEFEIFGHRIDGTTGIKIDSDPIRLSDVGQDGVTTATPFHPDVVYNPFRNEYLVVWAANDPSGELDDNEYEIYGQRIDGATGHETGINDFRISSLGTDGDPTARTLHPNVTYNSKQNIYLVTWDGLRNDLTPSHFEIYGQLLDGTTAQEIGTNDFKISTMGDNTEAFTYFADSPATVYNPSQDEFLVVWRGKGEADTFSETGTEVFAQRLDGTSGELLSLNHLRLSDINSDIESHGNVFLGPDVAYNETQNEYLVVWSADDPISSAVGEFEIFGQRLRGVTATEIGQNDFRISDLGADGNPAFDATRPRVTYDPVHNEYLVVFRGDDNIESLVNDEFEIFAQRINARTGEEVGMNDLRLSDMGESSNALHGDANEPAVAFNPRAGSTLTVWRGDDGDMNSGELGSEIYGQLFGISSDLAVELLDSAHQAAVFETKSYTLRVTNTGPNIAKEITLSNALPDGLKITSLTATDWDCDSQLSVTCHRELLESGATSELVVVGTLESQPSGEVENLASVESLSFDQESENNFAQVQTSILGIAQNAEQLRTELLRLRDLVKQIKKKRLTAARATGEQSVFLIRSALTQIELKNKQRKRVLRAIRAVNKFLKTKPRTSREKFKKRKQGAKKKLRKAIAILS